MRHVTPRELKERLERPDAAPVLLDVREPWEHAIAHIPGSELVPMRDVPTAMREFDLNQEIVVICHHGIRSYQVCHFLERAGFQRLTNLTGGISAWRREVDPRMKDY